jgi:hypothetical protein
MFLRIWVSVAAAELCGFVDINGKGPLNRLFANLILVGFSHRKELSQRRIRPLQPRQGPRPYGESVQPHADRLRFRSSSRPHSQPIAVDPR